MQYLQLVSCIEIKHIHITEIYIILYVKGDPILTFRNFIVVHFIYVQIRVHLLVI